MRKDKELIINTYHKTINEVPSTDPEKATDEELDKAIKSISKTIWFKVYHIISEMDYNMLRSDNSLVYVIAPEFSPDEWYEFNKEILETKKNTKDLVQKSIDMIKKYWNK